MQCAIPAMPSVAMSETHDGRHVRWEESVVRSALQAEVGRHCCWGSRPAADMQIANTCEATSYYMKVVSFVESRDMKPKTVPYLGDFVDGPQNGQAPSLWRIQVTQPHLFQSKSYQTPVPHTEEVHTCSTC